MEDSERLSLGGTLPDMLAVSWIEGRCTNGSKDPFLSTKCQERQRFESDYVRMVRIHFLYVTMAISLESRLV